MISERTGSNEDESVDHFIKTITIARTHKSIFKKRKNDFAKEKNQNDLSGNRFSSLENIFFVPKNRSSGNILQEAGNKLKEDYIFLIFPGNKLKEDACGIQEDGNKLKEDYPGLKNLGKRLIFVETFRKNGEPVFHFGLRRGLCF